MREQTRAALWLLPLATVALAVAALAADGAGYDWRLPKGFPKPRIPASNPMTAAKVELGRYLFYDTRLSVNGKSSCATCHKQELAFTDGRAAGLGATGESHSRGAMTLVNVAYQSALTWSNPTLTALEEQALTPMFGVHPVELGLAKGDAFAAALRDVPKYRDLFASAFPGEADPYATGNVTRALACFERSIISGDSPYDRYHYGGDDSAVSDSVKRGEVLFFSQPFNCFRCHSGFNFSDATTSEVRPAARAPFHNTGLYNLAGGLSYPVPNVGIYEYTKQPKDVGRFKAPSLRNVAVTAPYMHDGSVATLDAVIDHYAAGGRTVAAGDHPGVGHDNPNKDPLVAGFTITRQQREDLIAFLQSLTDESLLHNPRFANPW